MNDVKDLNMTEGQPTQTISLSAITGDGLVDKSRTVSVESAPERPTAPTIRINPTKRSTGRKSVMPGEVQQLNPDEFIEKPEPAPVKTRRGVAMAELDKAVARKQNEYKEFVEKALEDDEINRERVAAGLETVGDEMQYMPDPLFTPMKEEDKVKGPVTTTQVPEFSDDEDFEDFLDDEDVKEEFQEEAPVSNVVVQDPFAFEDEVVVEENTTDEDFEIMKAGDTRIIEDPDETTVTYEDAGPAMEEYGEEPSMEEKEVIEEIDEEETDITKNEISVTSDILKAEEEVIKTSSSSDFDIDEEDFDDVKAPISEDDLTPEQYREISNMSEKRLRAEILQKVIQAGKTIDTSQFVVSNKVINIKDAIKPSETKVQRTAYWPMTFCGRPFKASALKGPEIALLADADDSESRTSVGLTIDQAKIMFEHDANPYRPANIEAWAKTIPFLDVDNIFAALYVASLKGTNYVPNICPKPSCQYSYLSEDIDINTMVKFNNDNAKKRFEDVKKVELTPENTGSYESVVNVINDKFAVGLKIPSIFTILYEYGSLDAEFIRKYTTPVSIIQYVDYIYLINEETQQYQPIGWKSYPGDYAKTFKSKIATYAKILKELDDTDFSILIALINSMVNKAADNRGIYFEIPETKCPKCGSTIAAREISPRGLVFMRQRLVELATTPTER